MEVPLLDLKAQYATIKDEVLAAVAEVLESQVCIGGPKVAELEQKIAAISDCTFAVGVSSGTDALLCSLMALGIGPGDEVITTPFTFFATAGSIARTGATPVFVDIDPRTYNINPELIGMAVTSRTKAIMPVHLFGQMCDMDPIMRVASAHSLYVIEDAAQSITATYKGRKAGSIGSCGCFSFFPSKNLGGAGDGGMIVTNDEALYRKMTLLRNHGAEPKYFHSYIGGNFRLDALQASILLVKSSHLDEWSEARRRNARYYNGRFAESQVGTPFVREDCSTIYNQYVVRVPQRDALLAYLKAISVGAEVYYPLPIHLQACFAHLGYRKGAYPIAELAAQEVLALPCYPELTIDMREHVAETVLTGLNSLTASHKVDSVAAVFEGV
jgi:dTDP-4-amino-4,6-dideoxygalactose transaminase